METLAIGDWPELDDEMPKTGQNQIMYDTERPIHGFNRRAEESERHIIIEE